MRRLSALLAILFYSALAQGQDKPPNATASARVHFKSGLEHAASGELEAALRDFEAAYELQPHYSVLYNIGQAHAALGHPIEAIQAFERHLLEGGNRLSQNRRDQVRQLIANNRAKLGAVSFLGVTDTTRVWVDGVEIERAALGRLLPLAGGKHSILSSNGGGFPASQEVLVKPTSTTELTLATTPAAAVTHQSAPTTAQLRIVCDLPGVSVEIDGTRRATTPLASPLTVEAGPRRVTFSRAGYRPITHHVEASPEGPSVAPCDQVMTPELAPATRATLIVQTVPFDAELFVDGQRFLGAPLPNGPHELRVERTGYVGQRKLVTLRPREVTTHQVVLQPTARRQSEVAQAKSRRKIAGYAAGGSGVAFAVTSLALLGWNRERYDTWKREHSAATVGGQLQSVASIQRVDDIAVGCAALGVGLIAVGAWLFVSEPPEPR